jgi:C-terminal processing protease CtpA/Prc
VLLHDPLPEPSVAEGEQPRIELAGIGAVLSADGDVMRIERTVEGGGAAEVGLTEGDAILEVNGAPVGDLGFGGCIERIRGPEGSTVRLRVLRGGRTAPEVIDVPRRRIRA